MSLQKLTYLLLAALCSTNIYATNTTPDFWKNATVYFMLTDRFNNGDPSNDASYDRNEKAAKLRGFEGGDIKGIIEKIEEGYFTQLGIDAIWMTPIVEQVHGYDDSDGLTYSYHGYWPKDWTTVDKNYGTEADLKTMIAVAHQHNIKILLDVIINHTGPETQSDWAWPPEWVRTEPICQWHNYKQNTQCALATSLTDVKTENEADVTLPAKLINKWKNEGRLAQELSELDAFFKRTGYPRAPKYYIVKWLTDWVKEYGVDGFRADTVKHVDADIWSVLKKESEISLNTWKINNPTLVKDDLPFYMVGEVMHWGMNSFKNTTEDGRGYDFGDKQVDYFEHGFDALINMGFAAHAEQPAEKIFSSYSQLLNNGALKDKGILSYIGSHDDHDSFDRKREQTFEAAFKLMMAPGGIHLYYGDELARPMYAAGAYGDAHMRTFMNWEDLNTGATKKILAHWQKLGQFRRAHDAVGSGAHTQLNQSPYIFKRGLAGKNSVVVAKGLPAGQKTISAYNVFKEGELVTDYYSNQSVRVKNGKISLDTDFTYLLMGKVK